MVKKNAQAEVNRIAELEAQNQKQQEEIAKLKAKQDKVYADFLSTSKKDIVDEIEALRKQATKGSALITVRESADHKNVSLWTPWGKRIGPMHPENLESVYKCWRAVNNVILRAKQPTPEEIQSYNESPEGQARIEAEKKSRALKQKSLKKGEIDRLAKLIADSVGGNADRLKYAGAN